MLIFCGSCGPCGGLALTEGATGVGRSRSDGEWRSSHWTAAAAERTGFGFDRLCRHSGLEPLRLLSTRDHLHPQLPLSRPGLPSFAAEPLLTSSPVAASMTLLLF